ncbi:MAG: transglycosylase domain-containing protein [Pelolinea sp.]|nr:transglycosylase domain-containing protein [Pelolinea sp.]
MDNNQHEPGNKFQETASERLRRILAATKTEQQVESLGDLEKSEVKTSPKNLEDTSPIQISRADGVDSEIVVDHDNGHVDTEETGQSFSEIVKEQYQSIKENIGLIFKKTRKKRTYRNQGSQPPGNGKKPGLFSRFGKSPKSCILYGLLGLTIAVIVIGILTASFLIFQYFRIAAGLPSVDDLQQYASQFETTRIYDRNGNLIYEILDPNAGRRTYTSLENISPYVIAATIATEDKDFYTNPGFDPWGILRALWQNYTTGRVVSGASTITQQLARSLLLSPEERSQVTTQRKAREIVLAAEITRKYSKDEILELYLNEIYYGNIAYGIEAASETYFNTNADQLNLAQASFLAGLPQAPAVYDVFTNREGALLRHQDVLNLMYQLSSDRNCIRVNQWEVPVCVRLDEAVAAVQEIENYPFAQRPVNMPFPHWVNYIRMQLESQFDPQTIYRSGFKVYTTLDPDLQNYAQSAVKTQVDKLVENDATDGALVAIRPASGEILAMVGSADFFNEAISGQVNMAISPRQPGSSIKPLTYTAAFEKGWTPATLIWDVPSEFPPSGNPDDTREPYKPVNYDGKFHGPVRARNALGSSYNMPAVKVLDFVRIYDNPETSEKDGFIAFAERMGITTLTREDYGLSLTLGGGDVSLLELTGAFSIFANGGVRQVPFAISKIEDHFGKVVYEHPSQPGEQVIRADHAYLISDILSDNGARSPAFGSNSVLNLPFKAAVKTGTTNNFHDNWTLGYTPDIAVGVWIGNADYTPMKNVSGVTGAAPLWSDVIQWEINRTMGGNPTSFKRPDSIEDIVICKASGTKPSDRCPDQTSEIFAKDQPPLDKKDDLWWEIAIDTWTNLRAGPACSEFTEEKLTLNVSEKWARKWIRDEEAGRSWAAELGFSDPVIFTPSRECKGDDPRPTIVFVGLNDGMTVSDSPLDIYVVVSATGNFESFKLQYGIGNNPSKWHTLFKSGSQVKEPEKLVSWDVYQADLARVTLRIVITSTKGTSAEKRIHINLNVPTLTPMPEPTMTATPEPTWTPVPTDTPIPVLPTDTSIPSDTPIPLDTLIPTDTFTPAP